MISRSIKKIAIAFLAVGAAVIMPSLAFAAAQVSFVLPAVPVTTGMSFPVKVLLDTDRVVNAYSVTLRASGPIQIVGTSNAGSLITVWHQDPTVNGNQVHFEGGSLAPFAGTGGQLLTINVKAVASGTAAFSADGANVYLADGRGTRLEADNKTATLIIKDQIQEGGNPQVEGISINDDAAPEIKFLNIVHDPLLTEKKLLSFLVSDNGSGVKTSSIRYRTGIAFSAWEPTANPATIPNSAWEIQFKTEDNAGNSVEQTVYDWQPLWIIGLEIMGAFIVIIGAVVVLIAFRRRK